MTLATFPINIYSTRRTFGDCGADDMQYGDISAERLQNEFNLTHISNVVDPFTLTRLTPFHNPQSRFAGLHGNQPIEKLTAEECASLLFAELQATSLPFSMVGSQRFLINRLLDHLKRSSGMPFRDNMLDRAYYDKIVNDSSTEGSLNKIKKKFDEEFKNNKKFTAQFIKEIRIII